MFPIRDDQPHNTRSTVTITIIAINVLVFLFEMSLIPEARNVLIMRYGLVPTAFHVSALFTSMFLHGGWAHIAGNMLFLWAFGRSLETAMGHSKFLVFYLLCGAIAGMSQNFFYMDSNAPMVGASGAIAGVMGAYLLKFPRARIRTLVFFGFIFTTEIPALFMLLYWFLTQLVSGFGAVGYSHLSRSGTAWFAHIGGFIAGMVLVKVIGTNPVPALQRRVDW